MREYQDLYLIVFDGDFLNNSVPLRVSVQDQNDNIPTFTPNMTRISISEATLVGSEIFTAVATDLDDTINGQVTYSLEGVREDFQINPLSGVITLVTPLDFEMQESYLLRVMAIDGGTPMLQSALNLNITILDENDNFPNITNPMPFYSIRENTAGIGVFVGTVYAIDADAGSNAVLRFRIVAGNEEERFSIHPETGVIFTNRTIDREEQSVYSLTVEVN